MTQIFSVPVFIIVLRETTEAAIILSVLLALVEQIVKHNPIGKSLTERWTSSDTKVGADGNGGTDIALNGEDREKRLIRRLRIQVRRSI